MSLLCICVKKARLIGNAERYNTYVTLKLQNVKSTTIQVKGNNPSWEQDFMFETMRLDTGLIIEVWNKGMLWDSLLGLNWLPLQKIHHSNQEGQGKWFSLDGELIMKNGEIVGTRGSTGHSILIDARFELPYGYEDWEDLPEKDAVELESKLQALNSIMDQGINQYDSNQDQLRRQTYSQSGMSEDSDYTSDVNFPVQHHHNSSAHQFRGEHQFRLQHEDSKEYYNNESFDRGYEREPDYYQDGGMYYPGRSDTDSEPLYYNSRPNSRPQSFVNDSPVDSRVSSLNVSRQSTQDYSPVNSRISSADVSRQSTQDYSDSAPPPTDQPYEEEEKKKQERPELPSPARNRWIDAIQKVCSQLGDPEIDGMNGDSREKWWARHANGGPPEHNTFYTSIDSMPEIKPRRKSIPFVSDLVGTHCSTMPLDVAFMSQAKISVIFTVVINFVVTG